MARPKSDQTKTSKSVRLTDVMIEKAEAIAKEKGFTDFSDWVRFLVEREIDEYEKKKPNATKPKA